MSIPVELSQLATTVGRYRFAYLLTSAHEGAPHVVAVTPAWQDGRFVIAGLGQRTRTNAGERPAVALVWPPQDASEPSLIVDGQATVDGQQLMVIPARAVLHRPAGTDRQASSVGDCARQSPPGSAPASAPGSEPASAPGRQADSPGRNEPTR